MFGMVESLEILKVERRGLSIYIWVYMAMSPLCCGWEKKMSFQKIRVEYMERGHWQRTLEMVTPPRQPISLLLTSCAKLRSLACLPFHISTWVFGPVAWLAPGYFPYVISPNAPKRPSSLTLHVPHSTTYFLYPDTSSR